MSNEQRKDEEVEVEGHVSEADVSDDEPSDDTETEFEAHIKFPNVRMD
jgi:hypothetical protein